MKNERGGSTSKGGRMSGTRVTTGGKGETPIAGSPQKGNARMSGGRVASPPGLSRKNDPKGKTSGSMGLKIGSRVTSKDVGR